MALINGSASRTIHREQFFAGRWAGSCIRKPERWEFVTVRSGSKTAKAWVVNSFDMAPFARAVPGHTNRRYSDAKAPRDTQPTLRLACLQGQMIEQLGGGALETMPGSAPVTAVAARNSLAARSPWPIRRRASPWRKCIRSRARGAAPAAERSCNMLSKLLRASLSIAFAALVRLAWRSIAACETRASTASNLNR